jgi:hypothetical protein
MMFMMHIEIIMEGFDCDYNQAFQRYQRSTVWEDV